MNTVETTSLIERIICQIEGAKLFAEGTTEEQKQAFGLLIYELIRLTAKFKTIPVDKNLKWAQKVIKEELPVNLITAIINTATLEKVNQL